MAVSSSSPPSAPRLDSGLRRRVVRISTDLGLVIARQNGEKFEGRMLDLSLGGMHIACTRTPGFGEAVKVIVRLAADGDWLILPATVRWFTSRGFGVELRDLDGQQQRVLAAFIAAQG